MTLSYHLGYLETIIGKPSNEKSAVFFNIVQRSKAFWTMLKKTALFLHGGFPYLLSVWLSSYDYFQADGIMRTSHSHPTSWWKYSHPLVTWLRGFHHYHRQLEFFIVIKLYKLLLHVSKVTLTDFSSVLYFNGFLGTSTKRCCRHLNILQVMISERV